jgi:putative membrane protein
MTNVHLQLFKGLMQFSLLRRLSAILLVSAIYAALVSLVKTDLTAGKALLETNSALFVGVILSLLLVFRTNSAYDRWWEGRRQWGQLVNDVRSASAKVDQLLVVGDSDREAFGKLLIEFATSLKDHLRVITAETDKTVLSPSLVRTSTRKPLAVLHDIYALVGQWKKDGRIDGMDVLVLDPHLRSFSDVLGACERICLSPITYGHKGMLLHMILVYILFVPWALAPSLGMWDIPFVLVGVYMVLGLEVVAEAKEHPFGLDEEDLPLERLCGTIESSVNQLLRLCVPMEDVV